MGFHATIILCACDVLSSRGNTEFQQGGGGEGSGNHKKKSNPLPSPKKTLQGRVEKFLVHKN